MITDSFVTGSRIYGTPGADSDYDIVIRCDKKDSILFGAQEIEGDIWSGTSPEYPIDDMGWHVKLNNVDFILCFTDERFNNWKLGTEKLKLIAPVSRNIAKAMFKDLFAREKKIT